MAHYSHPRELDTDSARLAVERITSTGAVMRAQAPLIAHVNDDESVWQQMWTTQVRVGMIPYYMFVERDTGAKRYFEVTLERALDIYSGALRQVSGLARTVRGPVMSATPGKVLVDAVAEVGGERVFVLKMLQDRHVERANCVFFARYDEHATWFDQLEPALGTDPSWFPHLADRPDRDKVSLLRDEHPQRPCSDNATPLTLRKQRRPIDTTRAVAS
jgi:hypothetical protein